MSKRGIENLMRYRLEAHKLRVLGIKNTTLRMRLGKSYIYSDRCQYFDLQGSGIGRMAAKEGIE